jgi:hypothetical protein
MARTTGDADDAVSRRFGDSAASLSSIDANVTCRSFQNSRLRDQPLIGGAQVGDDVYSDTTASGHRNHYGFFLGFARATGDVNGFALGHVRRADCHRALRRD